MHTAHLTRPLGLSAAAVGLGLAVTAGLTGVAGATPTPPPPPHALFVQTDAPTGNQILAYQRGSDGTISLAGTYASGGDGAVASGAHADPLASQGSLTLALGGQVLLAVNAGSDSVSVFTVDGTQLTLTQTLGSEGPFPSSIAVHGPWVEVLDAGGAGKVAEFKFTGDHLAAVAGEARSLGLGNVAPVPNFLASPGQVGFTPAGSQVIVTTKASTKVTSSYEVLSVSPSGVLGASPVVTAGATPAPFAFAFDAAGHLVATEAGASNVSTYTVNADGTLSLIGSAADGATALCWLSVSAGVVYGSNAGSGTVSTFDLSPTTGAPTLANATAATTPAGTTDSAIDPSHSFLYVQSGGAGALDVYKIGTAGSLSPVETVWNLPVASEGLAIS